MQFFYPNLILLIKNFTIPPFYDVSYYTYSDIIIESSSISHQINVLHD